MKSSSMTAESTQSLCLCPRSLPLPVSSKQQRPLTLSLKMLKSNSRHTTGLMSSCGKSLYCQWNTPLYTQDSCTYKRYFVRVTVGRRLSDTVKEKDLWVYSYKMPPEMNNAIKMEVGIEDCLHIEFEYNKSKYHLRDVIVGKIYFLLVRIKIKNMELSIIRRETTGAAPNQYNESETITKFEIMDGAPVRGIAFFLTTCFGVSHTHTHNYNRWNDPD